MSDIYRFEHCRGYCDFAEISVSSREQKIVVEVGDNCEGSCVELPQDEAVKMAKAILDHFGAYHDP
jgi:uncharacterized FlaG/YvyC family protein